MIKNKKAIIATLLATSFGANAYSLPSNVLEKYESTKSKLSQTDMKELYQEAKTAYRNTKGLVAESDLKNIYSSSMSTSDLKAKLNSFSQSGAGTNGASTKGDVDFSSTKDWLKKITKLHPYGFYTDCPIDIEDVSYGSGKKGIVINMSPTGCGLSVKGYSSRATRGEAEHIVPASWFGYKFDCWKKGRSYCSDHDKTYAAIEGDPLNLQYVYGNINAERSNYKYGEFGYTNDSQTHDYLGNGDVLFDNKNKLFEPPESKKGWIGRAHLYMHDKYNVEYSKRYYALMRKWASYPTTDWECKYNGLVKRDFGFSNPYVDNLCK